HFPSVPRRRTCSLSAASVRHDGRSLPAFIRGARALYLTSSHGAIREIPMPNAMKYVDVAVPVSAAYNQWTQFEEFPFFMEGVEEVKQLDDQRLHWRAKIGGREEEWNALITEQLPD